MFRLKLSLALAAAATAAFGLSVPSSQAQSVTCGQNYTVSSGDTLSRIAQRAYGSVSSFQIIYSANAQSIGRDPSVIRLGASLFIPCLDESGAPSTADSSNIRETATTEALPAPEVRKIRIVTGTDWAPFTDESQEQGGMLNEIVNVALTRAESKPDFKIDFINDWGAHLRPLISDHAYDLSIAWFRPNCDVVERLGDGSKFRCNNLDWSEPLFEQIIGYYVLAGAEVPKAPSDMFGKTICRPSGYAIFMLEERELVPPNVELLRPNTTEELFQLLLDGKCSVAIIASEVGDGAIAKLGATDKIVAVTDLAQVATLHAVISKTHPRGKEILATLNDGLSKIKADATWFQIVQRHMVEHRKKSAGKRIAQGLGSYAGCCNICTKS